MASKGLTECWREAMPAKPPTWKLMGVARALREVDLGQRRLGRRDRG